MKANDFIVLVGLISNALDSANKVVVADAALEMRNNDAEFWVFQGKYLRANTVYLEIALFVPGVN